MPTGAQHGRQAGIASGNARRGNALSKTVRVHIVNPAETSGLYGGPAKKQKTSHAAQAGDAPDPEGAGRLAGAIAQQAVSGFNLSPHSQQGGLLVATAASGAALNAGSLNLDLNRTNKRSRDGGRGEASCSTDARGTPRLLSPIRAKPTHMEGVGRRGPLSLSERLGFLLYTLLLLAHVLSPRLTCVTAPRAARPYILLRRTHTP